MQNQNDNQSSDAGSAPSDPARQASGDFLSRMVGLAALLLIIVGIPLAYMLNFDIWTVVFVAIFLLFIKRFFKEETSVPESVADNWEDYANEVVHEVKNQLMDFFPDQYGGPDPLADHLEGVRGVLDEGIERLRRFAEEERRESEETDAPESGMERDGSEEEKIE